MSTKHVKFYRGRPLYLGLFDAKEYGFDPLNMLSVVPDLSVVLRPRWNECKQFLCKMYVNGKLIQKQSDEEVNTIV